MRQSKKVIRGSIHACSGMLIILATFLFILTAGEATTTLLLGLLCTAIVGVIIVTTIAVIHGVHLARDEEEAMLRSFRQLSRDHRKALNMSLAIPALYESWDAAEEHHPNIKQLYEQAVELMSQLSRFERDDVEEAIPAVIARDSQSQDIVDADGKTIEHHSL